MATDELKKIYEGEGKLAYFFEQATPVNLFRRRNIGDKTMIMQPTVIGFGPDEKPRLPDIRLEDEAGASPQFDGSKMRRESNSKPLTKEIVGDASKYIVKGCRTTKGDYRGVSVFDMVNPRARGVEWFYIEANTKIPPGLAVTQDGNKRTGESLHYTIAPKDNMPFALFLQHLKGLEAILKKQST
jgi:hypothetical protein